MVILKQMVIFYFMMLLGFWMGKREILDDHSSQSISWIVVNIANPALILSGALSESKPTGDELMTTICIAIGMYLALIVLAYIIVKLFRFKVEEQGLYEMMFVFSNIGFMGFPMISAVYGDAALLHATIYLLPFNLLMYTLGLRYVQKGKSTSLKSIANIGVIASLTTLAIYFGNISLPSIATKTIEMLSDLTGPLSMMVIGFSFTKIKIKEIVSNLKMVLFVVIRLTIIPILGIFIVRQITDQEMIINVFRIIIAAPIGSMCAMMAKQYGGDDVLCSKGIALSTLVAGITMPLIVMWF